MKKVVSPRFIILLSIILLTGMWRVLQNIDGIAVWNFSPIGAMALFGGVYFSNRSKAYLLPVAILFSSDVVLMQTLYSEFSEGLLYSGWYWTYAAFLLMVTVGTFIRKVNFKTILSGSLTIALLHFLVVNFGVWLGGGLDMSTGQPYTRDLNGLLHCYGLAIPFLKNMIAGNILYGAILFGGFEWLQYRFPALNNTVSIS